MTAKLRSYSDLLTACLDRVTAAPNAEHPEMGANVVISGSDSAPTNGQWYVSKNGLECERYSDPDRLVGTPFRRRVRERERVRLHADLTILARLATALSRAGAVVVVA